MKQIKLKDIINLFDDGAFVIIEMSTGLGRDNWEEVFKGRIYDIPWHYLDCYLTSPNKDFESISIFEKDDELNNNKAGFYLTLYDEDDIKRMKKEREE